MNHYHWHGINAQGQRTRGKMMARNSHHVRERCQANSITVLQIKRKIFPWLGQGQKKIRRKQIADFTRQLATLTQAGLALTAALELIAQDELHSGLQTMTLSLKQAIEQGMSFSQALSEFPHLFDPIYCSLIYAGECSGTLMLLLSQLATYQERMLALGIQITRALYYPLTIASVGLVISWGLLIFIVPQFQTVFANFGVALPLFTRIIIQMGKFFRQHALALSAFFPLAILASKKTLQYSPRCAHRLDKILVGLPWVSSFIALSNLARWSRVLATLLQAGIPVLYALQIASDTFSNQAYRQQSTKMIAAVQAGIPLYQALQKSPLFPHRLVKMIAVGENSGTLTIMLEKIADIYSASIEEALSTGSKLLEPIILLLLALLAGSFIVAMYLPMFKIGAIF